MKCKLCEREARQDFCEYHAEAKRQLETAFHMWKEAYGGIAWNEYLRRMVRNKEAGQWVVEIANLSLQSLSKEASGERGA